MNAGSTTATPAVHNSTIRSSARLPIGLLRAPTARRVVFQVIMRPSASFVGPAQRLRIDSSTRRKDPDEVFGNDSDKLWTCPSNTTAMPALLCCQFVANSFRDFSDPLNDSSRKSFACGYFCSARATGLEPATTGSTVRYSVCLMAFSWR